LIKLLPYITHKVELAGFKYELHTFNSGALMVDIWAEERFYVLHIEQDVIGISLITEETIGFDNIPDCIFRDTESVKKEFEKIFVFKNS
jgi:hypothetical protein